VTTSAFGLLTSDGRFIRFDDHSNMRVIEVVQGNDIWNKHLAEHTPVRVRVIGSVAGNVAVVESLDLLESQSLPVGEVRHVITRESEDVFFDVRYDDDYGKLIVTEEGIHFEDVSDVDESRSWNYSQIKGLERKGDDEIEVKPHSGDSFKFRVESPGMVDTVYRTLADRLVASRVHQP
jgi:hypothetical protein